MVIESNALEIPRISGATNASRLAEFRGWPPELMERL